jgi:short-subunit dehydrogenase
MTLKPNLPIHRNSYPFIAPTRFTGKLQGKRALVTGASHGIGRNTVQAFAAAGAHVACVSRNSEALDALVASLNTEAVAIPADITDTVKLVDVVREAESCLGGSIDILVNCAGGVRFNTFEAEDVDLRDWWHIFELNLRAPVALIRLVLPTMLKRGSGTIISFGSSAAVEEAPFCTAYAMSKTALTKFHAELEAEISGRGVDTYVLHPGEVDTGAAKVPGALNMDTLMATPRMATHLAKWEHIILAQPQLAADTVVALCAEERAKILSGKFIDARMDLEGLIEQTENLMGHPEAYSCV